MYGQSGSNYVIVTGTNLASTTNWTSFVGFTLSNSFEFINTGAASNRIRFFQAKRP